MTVDPLRWEQIREQARIIAGARSVDDRAVVDALVEVSSSLYEMQSMERSSSLGPRAGDALG